MRSIVTKTIQVIPALIMALVFLLSGAEAHAQTACPGQVQLIGPQNVETGGILRTDQNGYALSPVGLDYEYKTDDTCTWLVNYTDPDTGASRTQLVGQVATGQACATHAPTLNFENGQRFSTRFTVYPAGSDEQIFSCPASCTAGEICFDSIKPLEQTYPTAGGEGLAPTSSVGQAIRYAFIFGISIIGVAALFNLIIAGAQWTSAGGNANIIASAQKRIVATATGVVLLLSSYLILITINPELVLLEEPRLSGFVDSANCRQITTCAEYAEEGYYDFELEEGNTDTAKVVSRACNLDACSVARGGCVYNTNRSSDTAACQPRALENSGLSCTEPGEITAATLQKKKINSCQSYVLALKVATGNGYNRDLGIQLCEQDVCGIESKNLDTFCTHNSANAGDEFGWVGNVVVRTSPLSYILDGLGVVDLNNDRCIPVDCADIRAQGCSGYSDYLTKVEGYGGDKDYGDLQRVCFRDYCNVGPCKMTGGENDSSSACVPF